MRVGRKPFHEHHQTLNRFLRLVTGQTAADEIDFLQLLRFEQQFLPACRGQKDVDRAQNRSVNRRCAEFRAVAFSQAEKFSNGFAQAHLATPHPRYIA